MACREGRLPVRPIRGAPRGVLDMGSFHLPRFAAQRRSSSFLVRFRRLGLPFPAPRVRALLLRGCVAVHVRLAARLWEALVLHRRPLAFWSERLCHDGPGRAWSVGSGKVGVGSLGCRYAVRAACRLDGRCIFDRRGQCSGGTREGRSCKRKGGIKKKWRQSFGLALAYDAACPVRSKLCGRWRRCGPHCLRDRHRRHALSCRLGGRLFYAREQASARGLLRFARVRLRFSAAARLLRLSKEPK